MNGSYGTEDTSTKAWRASEINNEERRNDSKHVRRIDIEKEWVGYKRMWASRGVRRLPPYTT